MSGGQQQLGQAFDRLEQEAPDRARFIHWFRDPKARWVRLPLGTIFILASFAGPFLPIVGIEMLPLGLLLVALDVPFRKEPVARLTLWLTDKWVFAREWWQNRGS